MLDLISQRVLKETRITSALAHPSRLKIMDSDLNEAVRDELLRQQNQNLGFVIVGSLGVRFVSF